MNLVYLRVCISQNPRHRSYLYLRREKWLAARQGLSRRTHFPLWQRGGVLQLFRNLSRSPFSSKGFGRLLELFYMLMTLNAISMRLQGGDLKPFSCTQFQDHL